MEIITDNPTPAYTERVARAVSSWRDPIELSGTAYEIKRHFIIVTLLSSSKQTRTYEHMYKPAIDEIDLHACSNMQAGWPTYSTMRA